MKLILLAGILILLGCKSEPENQGPERTEQARIFSSGLAYDGCDARIQLLSDRQMYRPTAETLPLLNKALATLPTDSLSQVVSLRFTLTGNKATLQCGWGAKSEVGEMQVVDIQKR